MALVDYGSSDESVQEEQKPVEPQKPKSKASTKPAFQKLVDSSNPNKIKINVAPTDAANKNASDEPPSKKVKIGGAGFKDFNSFLPPPKRTAPQLGGSRGGLGKGVNLKTGSAPAFSREPVEVEEAVADPPQSASNEGQSVPTSQGDGPDVAEETETSPIPDIPKKKSTIFKPLSVARKPQKKKPPLPQGSTAVTATTGTVTGPEANKAKPASKVSLFSSHDATADDPLVTPESKSNGGYEPILYQPSAEPTSSINPYDTTESLESFQQPPAPIQPEPDSLDAIADSLNLSSSQRRQLLGRNANSSSAQAIKVTNFNIDEEYAANEVLRQNGETVQHKAVRPIQGGGKHSLRQLVTSAVGQKDALDEKFADGSRNRKEGASRYGW